MLLKIPLKYFWPEKENTQNVLQDHAEENDTLNQEKIVSSRKNYHVRATFCDPNLLYFFIILYAMGKYQYKIHRLYVFLYA